MKIEINLLPEWAKKKESYFKNIDLSQIDFNKLPIVKIAIVTVVSLVILHAVLFFIGIAERSGFNSASKRFDDLLPDRKIAEALKEQSDVTARKIAAIDELMVKRFSWARKLNDLGDSITPGIWLSELSYKETMVERPVAQQPDKNHTVKGRKEPGKPATEKIALKQIFVSGYANRTGDEGTALISKFIKSLKDNSGFYSDLSDIELESIKSEKMEDQEVMNFKIICLFK